MIWNKGKNGTKCKLFLNMIRFPIVIGKIYQVRVLVSLKMIFEPKITTQQLNIKIFTLSIAFLRISKVKFSAHAIQFGSLKICMWYWLMTFKSFFFLPFLISLNIWCRFTEHVTNFKTISARKYMYFQK